MKIAIIGYGKMGKMIEQIARGRGHEIVCIIDVDNPQDFDSPEFASADVAIEFTNPTAAYGNYLKAFAKGVKVVSGSTGWMKDHGDDVRRMCNDEGKTLFWASNFSVGVATFGGGSNCICVGRSSTFHCVFVCAFFKSHLFTVHRKGRKSRVINQLYVVGIQCVSCSEVLTVEVVGRRDDYVNFFRSVFRNIFDRIYDICPFGNTTFDIIF